MPPRYYDDDDEESEDLDVEAGSCDEDDGEEEENEEEYVTRVEQAFRAERARIRACRDIADLRAMRADYQQSISGGQLSQAARIRSNDLIELIDDRITDLKARQFPGRRY